MTQQSILHFVINWEVFTINYINDWPMCVKFSNKILIFIVFVAVA